MSFVCVTPGRRIAGGRSSPIWKIGLPVLVVGVVVLGLIGLRLAVNGGNLTSFIQFGHALRYATHPPHGALVRTGTGYDGQFFYIQARDPLLLHHSTIAAMRAAGAGFRLQRMAYPTLAFLLAGGNTAELPLTLLAINALVLLGVAGFFAAYARRRGWPALWAVALVLMPGLLLPAMRDLSDPLATASVLAGVLLAQSGKRWWAAAALTVAVLTREVAMLVILAFAVELGLRAWQVRRQPGGWRPVLRQGWPMIVLPGAAFTLWQLYVMARYGGPVGGAAISIPVLNLIQGGPPLDHLSAAHLCRLECHVHCAHRGRRSGDFGQPPTRGDATATCGLRRLTRNPAAGVRRCLGRHAHQRAAVRAAANRRPTTTAPSNAGTLRPGGGNDTPHPHLHTQRMSA